METSFISDVTDSFDVVQLLRQSELSGEANDFCPSPLKQISSSTPNSETFDISPRNIGNITDRLIKSEIGFIYSTGNGVVSKITGESIIFMRISEKKFLMGDLIFEKQDLDGEERRVKFEMRRGMDENY
jgi:hypothetical protein